MGDFKRHPITSQDERQCAAMAQAFEKVLTPAARFIATIAFERKVELGGGYRGVVAVYESDGGRLLQRLESPIKSDLFSAGSWAYETAHEIIGSRPFRVGHYNGNRWRKNYWISA